MENTPPPPPPSLSSPPPLSSPPSPISLPSFQFDPRTIATMKASALWNAVSSAISAVFGHISLFFIGGVIGEFARAFGGIARDFPVRDLISEVIWGAVYGAIIGFCISKYFDYLKRINQQYLKSRLNTFFKFLFYPSIVISVIVFLMTSVVGFAIGFMPLIITAIGVIVSSYVYAKMVTKAVGSLYGPTV